MKQPTSTISVISLLAANSIAAVQRLADKQTYSRTPMKLADMSYFDPSGIADFSAACKSLLIAASSVKM